MVERLVLLLFAGLFFVACTDKEKARVEATTEALDSMSATADTLILVDEEPVPKTVDELFNDFFYSFASDGKFQMSRVSFPLTVNEDGATHKISRSEWNAKEKFLQEDFYSVIYERERDMYLFKDTAVAKVRVRRIDLDNLSIESFHFDRTDGHWGLVGVDKYGFSKSSNRDFLSFYASFMSDTVDQCEHIVFPLKYILSAEGEISDGAELELSEDEWKELREEIPMPSGVMTDIDYGQACISQNRKVLLVQGVSNGLYIKYKFDRDGDGHWQLYEIEN